MHHRILSMFIAEWTKRVSDGLLPTEMGQELPYKSSGNIWLITADKRLALTRLVHISWALWSNKLAFIIHIKLFLLEICVKIKRFLEFSRQGLSIGNLRIRHRKDQQSKDLMERPHHVIKNERFRLISRKWLDYGFIIRLYNTKWNEHRVVIVYLVCY